MYAEEKKDYTEEKRDKLIKLHSRYNKSMKKTTSEKYKKELERKFRKQYYSILIS